MKENVVTNTSRSTALETASAYHRAWTSGDLDGAFAHVADDIICRAPDGEITGKDAYRSYLGGFSQIMTGLTDIAAFGDDKHGLLFYYPHTAVTSTAPAAEHFTIRDGKIVESQGRPGCYVSTQNGRCPEDAAHRQGQRTDLPTRRRSGIRGRGGPLDFARRGGSPASCAVGAPGGLNPEPGSTAASSTLLARD